MASASDLPEPAPPAAATTTTAPPPPLSALLARARGTLKRLAAAEVAAATMAGAATGLAVALVLVGLVPFTLAVRTALQLLVLGGGAAAGVALALLRLRPLRHDLVVAARLEEALARSGVEAGDRVRGAVELADNRDDAATGRSRALADAHIDDTAALLAHHNANASLVSVALERAVPTALWAAFVAAVFLVWGGLSSSTLSSRFDRLFDEAAAEKAIEERARTLLPLVTDLTITLRFPAYMASADEVIVGSTGDITAPRGTEVTLAGRADRTVTGGALLMGERQVALTTSDGRAVVGKFVVEEAGSYRFRLDTDGRSALDPVAHKITLRADAPPQVTFDEPAEDQTVKIDDVIDLAFGAKDDFGVTGVKVVVRRPGAARKPFQKDLMEVPGLREVRGTGKLTIRETGARPGEKLAVTIEALDNDSASGPKPGTSQTRILTVFSAAVQHEGVIKRLEDLLSRMVDSLADELEGPLSLVAAEAAKDVAAGKRALDAHGAVIRREEEMLAAFDEALAALAEDTMSPAATRRALANMRLQLGKPFERKRQDVTVALRTADRGQLVPTSTWRRLEGAQQALVARLEQDILWLEDMLQTERIAEAKQIADELKQSQQDLKELIEQFKESGDEKVREALMEEMQRMQAEMQKLMERLAKLQRDVPDEFLNEEAFQSDKLAGEMQSLDSLIQEGKLDEAAKLLEQMLEGTQELVENLEKTGEEYGGEEYKELRDKMERFADELQALERAQNEQAQRSEELLDKARARSEEKLKEKLKAAMAELKQKTQKAQQSLRAIDEDGLLPHEAEGRNLAEARAADLEKALESGDIEDALQAADEAAQASSAAGNDLGDRTRGPFASRRRETVEARRRINEATPLLQQVREKLADLLPDPASQLDRNERQRMQRSADEQQQLEESAQRLSQLMEQIGDEAPVFGPEHKGKLDEARQAMQQAARQLRGEDLRNARGAQMRARTKLAELQGALEQMGKGGQSGGGGMPMPLPGGGAPGSERREGDGRSGTEDVEIPDGSEFRVPDAYRKDILDAMREGLPEGFEGEVKRYYEELIR